MSAPAAARRCYLAGCERRAPVGVLFCGPEHRAEQEARNRTAGLCACGDTPDAGFVRCELCRLKARTATRIRAAEHPALVTWWTETGRCIRCGEERAGAPPWCAAHFPIEEARRFIAERVAALPPSALTAALTAARKRAPLRESVGTAHRTAAALLRAVEIPLVGFREVHRKPGARCSCPAALEAARALLGADRYRSAVRSAVESARSRLSAKRDSARPERDRFAALTWGELRSAYERAGTVSGAARLLPGGTRMRFNRRIAAEPGLGEYIRTGRYRPAAASE